jgi:hypothetical protein
LGLLLCPTRRWKRPNCANLCLSPLSFLKNNANKMPSVVGVQQTEACRAAAPFFALTAWTCSTAHARTA